MLFQKLGFTYVLVEKKTDKQSYNSLLVIKELQTILKVVTDDLN